MKSCKGDCDFQKLETFLFIFIFEWLGQKCNERREAEKSVKVVMLYSLGYLGSIGVREWL